MQASIYLAYGGKVLLVLPGSSIRLLSIEYIYIYIYDRLKGIFNKLLYLSGYIIYFIIFHIFIIFYFNKFN